MNSSDSHPPPAAAPKRAARRRLIRWLPYLGGLLLVALIVAGLWPKPAPVETATAVEGPLQVAVVEEGKTRVRQRYVVFAPLAGQLRRIPFQAGAELHAGDVVAVIDPLSPALLDARARAMTEARRDSAQAQLERAIAAETFATNELRRFERLFADKAVSPQEIEGAQWRQAAASRERIAAQSAVRQAEAELLDAKAVRAPGESSSVPTEVKAPASGRILRVFEESARVVNSGLPLLEIGDPNDLEVVVDVLSRDGAAILPGTRVELEQWGGGEPLQAKVRLVEPAAFTKVSALGVEEQRVNVVADLTTPPGKRLNLGDHFRVEARILVWETNRTLKIPGGALFRRKGEWHCFVIAAGRAALRAVTVGRSSGPEREIVSGLRAGETVILYPGDRVQDGQRVRPIAI